GAGSTTPTSKSNRSFSDACSTLSPGIEHPGIIQTVPYSKLQQIGLQLRVSLLLRPQVKRDRRHFIHDGFGPPAFRHVHRLDVGPATVASFHTDMIELLGGIDRKLGVVLLPASWTDDPPKLPFRQAK